MKKILAFGTSNSKSSINQKLATWSANQVDDVEVKILDINDYEMPIFSVDREQENGIPEKAIEFKRLIEESDGLILSFAEYNGSFTSAFKNIFDWISRVSKPIWSNKPTLLMATSPGPRGGLTVLSSAEKTFPYQGADIVGTFCLPSFNSNFSAEEGIINEELRQSFLDVLGSFESKVHRLEEAV